MTPEELKGDVDAKQKLREAIAAEKAKAFHAGFLFGHRLGLADAAEAVMRLRQVEMDKDPEQRIPRGAPDGPPL